jgi:hypothetical protein
MLKHDTFPYSTTCSLTGDRRAAGASSALRSFNIEPKFGLKALEELLDIIFCRAPFQYEIPSFIRESYESLDIFCDIASKAMIGAGLNATLAGHGCRLKRFLNRIFGIPLKLQTHIFDLFLFLVNYPFAGPLKTDSR